MPRHQHSQSTFERRARDRRENTDRREMIRFELLTTPRRHCNRNRRKIDDVWTDRDKFEL